MLRGYREASALLFSFRNAELSDFLDLDEV
jgi:hypothetical protein